MLAKQIKNEAKKQEVLAGIDVNTALLNFKERKWGIALEKLEHAQDLYQALSDKDRDVKIYHYKGDALYEMGSISDAKDVYREGLSLAKQLSRKDCILRNHIGLAKVANSEGDLIEAKRNYSLAAQLARDLGREALAQELESNVPKQRII